MALYLDNNRMAPDHKHMNDSIIHEYNKKCFTDYQYAIQSLKNKSLLPGEITIAYYNDSNSEFGLNALIAVGSLIPGGGNIIFTSSSTESDIDLDKSKIIHVFNEKPFCDITEAERQVKLKQLNAGELAIVYYKDPDETTGIGALIASGNIIRKGNQIFENTRVLKDYFNSALSEYDLSIKLLHNALNDEITERKNEDDELKEKQHHLKEKLHHIHEELNDVSTEVLDISTKIENVYISNASVLARVDNIDNTVLTLSGNVNALTNTITSLINSGTTDSSIANRFNSIDTSLIYIQSEVDWLKENGIGKGTSDASLSEEVEARKLGDASIQSYVDVNITKITNLINTELVNIKGEDTSIKNYVDVQNASIKNYVDVQNTTLQNQIAAETNNRVTADITLTSNINSINSSLSSILNTVDKLSGGASDSSLKELQQLLSECIQSMNALTKYIEVLNSSVNNIEEHISFKVLDE